MEETTSFILTKNDFDNHNFFVGGHTIKVPLTDSLAPLKNQVKIINSMLDKHPEKPCEKILHNETPLCELASKIDQKFIEIHQINQIALKKSIIKDQEYLEQLESDYRTSWKHYISYRLYWSFYRDIIGSQNRRLWIINALSSVINLHNEVQKMITKRLKILNDEKNQNKYLINEKEITEEEQLIKISKEYTFKSKAEQSTHSFQKTNLNIWERLQKLLKSNISVIFNWARRGAPTSKFLLSTKNITTISCFCFVLYFLTQNALKSKLMVR